MPLPLDYKLANIEDTEAAKRKLLEASASDSDDDDKDGKAGEPSLQRGRFPHGFGRKSAKEVNIREVAILKAKDMAFRRNR